MSEFTKVFNDNCHHFYNLYDACGKTFSRETGSYLFDGRTYEYRPEYIEKQELLMLLSNHNLEIVGIDIEDTYAKPAIEYLNQNFGNRIRFIYGNSMDVLPTLVEKFDFFHIDGYHENKQIDFELNQVKMLAKDVSGLIIDDADAVKSIIMHHAWNPPPFFLDMKLSSDPWRNIYFKLVK